MAIDPNPLPEDPTALRQIVIGLREEVESKELRLRQRQPWVEQRLRARYGPRRERVEEHRFFLFAAAILAQGGKRACDSEETEAPKGDLKPSSGRAGHGRQRLPKSLRRERRGALLCVHLESRAGG